jgi:hypothetical protein
MPGPTKLDGAGVQKLKTIDEAHVQLQRLHGIVEHFGLAVKQNKPASQYIQQVKRSLPVLVGLLKPQFGLIADQVAALNLTASRGGTDTTRLRTLREGVASIRQHLDIAIVRIKDNHALVEEPKPEGERRD